MQWVGALAPIGALGICGSVGYVAYMVAKKPTKEELKTLSERDRKHVFDKLAGKYDSLVGLDEWVCVTVFVSVCLSLSALCSYMLFLLLWGLWQVERDLQVAEEAGE
eukprot:GHVQ01031471.1.p2 GENE.GHVQ01031471.1~~GHVQ01031471.1.p2  ORF type:complete len:107 (+),score=16.03 GHVQ01031471.1:137-457(+)